MQARSTDIAEAFAGDAYHCEIPADPCAIVIFGASGDLAVRKLIPALYDLSAHACLAPRYAIVGFARTPMDDDSFRSAAGEAIRKMSEIGPADDAMWRAFAQCMAYVPGEYHHPEAFERLAARLESLDRERSLRGNRLFYLATPPDISAHVIAQLGRAGLARPVQGKSCVRIIIEKPFGRDLDSARRLNQMVLRVFDESQV